MTVFRKSSYPNFKTLEAIIAVTDMPTPKPLHPVSLHDAATFRHTLTRAVILPLILTAALAGLFLWQITRLLDATRWVEHTDEVISQSNRALKLLIDLETGVRGYLVTGRRDYLEPYERAAPQVRPALDELDGLVSDNPPQVVRVNEIRTLHEEWMGYARRSGWATRARSSRLKRRAETISRA